MSVPPRVLLEAVEEVARLAGRVALSAYGSGVAVELKGDGSPVTEADRRAEREAREWIRRLFPEDGIVGEEYGEERPGAPRRWFIDPIDGTKSFVRRVPLWGSLVGVEEGNAIVAGAACYPVVGEVLAAARGEGCWWNGERCAVSGVGVLEDATVLVTDATFASDARRRGQWDELARRARVVRTWGDCYGYLLVATGRAEVMVDEVLNVWDAGPFLPIIEEAGGVFTDWGGAATAQGGSAIATNAALARGVREILRP